MMNLDRQSTPLPTRCANLTCGNVVGEGAFFLVHMHGMVFLLCRPCANRIGTYQGAQILKHESEPENCGACQALHNA